MQKSHRNKFSTSDKLRAVGLVLDSGRSFNSVSQEFNTHHCVISLWVACYQAHGVSGLSLKSGRHSGDFKWQVLQDMFSNCLSLHQVSVKYRITPSVVQQWKRLYEQSGSDSLYHSKPVGRPSTMKKKVRTKSANNSDDSFAALQKENLYLRAENDYLKKLSALIQAKQMLLKKHKPLKN